MQKADFIPFSQLDEMDLNLDKLGLQNENNSKNSESIVGKFQEFHKLHADRPVLNTPVLTIAGNDRTEGLNSTLAQGDHPLIAKLSLANCELDGLVEKEVDFRPLCYLYLF